MENLDLKLIEQIDEMTQCLSEQTKTDLYGASAFWETLGEKHKKIIKESGFNKFKQTINFEYFQYEVSSLRDRKILSLIVLLLKEVKIPYGMFWAEIDSLNALKNLPKIRSDFSFKPKLYAVFMGLLWQYALVKDHLGCLSICDEPLVGEPIPVYYKGRLISQDLATSTIELNRVAQNVDMSKVKRVAEIGAGYGRFAYVTVSKYNDIEYCIFDIPPALAISQNYLSLVMGESNVQIFSKNKNYSNGDDQLSCRIKSFLPHQLESFPDGYFDLIVNISSFDEMNREQVENYFSLIDQKCNGFMYLKGHETKPTWCNVSGGGLAELPYKKGWKLEYTGKDPFIADFEDRIYSIHPNG